ncbi:NUDIX domain-containing protein [Candidatus Halobonum tyrrellensis]|uniref:Translation initiation factor IF-2 n=1 Tax=Candidatus Halobonum tyrrellensis G22 TaxID=1324957 RepID=V4GPG4_9EURY|nr:NUDIX domain-containing protein [Candidatus Halobonum tyrrellensis]ESP87271.1 translation initiation factor IF-2 [Candidatus Halobonum tyrrellensis G22]
MDGDHVVTAFLRDRGEVLLVRRSDAVGTYRGRWGGVSGYVEGDPDDALDDARREVREEAGVETSALTLVRAGETVAVDDEEGSFLVHPFLFDCASREVCRNEELAAHEWVQPTAMPGRRTVPKLWAAYRAVGPTVASVRDDRTHGSAYVSVRALETLRDTAADAAIAGDPWESVADTARALRDARPGMTALSTRVNRVMSEAYRTPAAVRDRAVAAVETAVEADDRAAGAVRDLLSGTVLTLSRSGTVSAALDGHDGAVLVAVSDPGGEGRGVATRLAGADREVTLLPDSAVAAALAERDVDAALVGADAVLPDGSVANKVGTRGLALAAAREGVPTYAVTARDKVRGSEGFDPGSAAGEFDAPEGVGAFAPLFDRTPADLVTVVTEDGPLDAAAVGAVAADHRALAAWDDAGSGDADGTADPDGSGDADPDERSGE